MIKKYRRILEEYITLILSFFVNSIFYRRKKLDFSKIHRLLVFKLDHIGDLILAIPALAALRNNFPKAFITLVVNPTSESLARLIPYVDEVLYYNPRFFDRTGKSKIFNFPEGIKFIRSMIRKKFDLVIDLRGCLASVFYALIGNAEYRLDRGTYLIKRKMGSIKLAPEHEALVNLDILKRAYLNPNYGELSLKLSSEDLENANSLLGKYSKSCIIAIHPGGPTGLKRWDLNMYVSLISKIKDEYNSLIILVGGKGDREIAKYIVSHFRGDILDISGQTSLGQLASILKKCDLFIGNDSGPMHLAAICGTKTIGLFGPTSPKRFGPFGEHCISIRKERNCPPCMEEKCKKPVYRCIDQISVNVVMEFVRKELNK